MSSQVKFMIFCAEQYKLAKHLTGRQLAELFSRYRDSSHKEQPASP